MPDLRDIHHPTSQNHPQVTIVIATYNRAEALKHSIRSAIAQTYTSWEMLVIGDACSDRTAEMIAEFGDSRIRFVNLPERFGEQAGPNSVGLMLAQTEYVAFLNHDDLWFPDHLDLALKKLNGEKAEIFWSRTAFYCNRGPRMDSQIFVESSPRNRNLRDAYDCPLYYAEPMSSWVVQTACLKELGPMALSSEIPIPPLQNYAIRAWQQGCTLATGDVISVLKDNMYVVHLPREARMNAYDLNPVYAENLLKLIEQGDLDLIRRKIEADMWLSKHLEMDRSFDLMKSEVQARWSEILKDAGLDFLYQKASASKVGFMGLVGRSLLGRTGEELRHQPDLAAMIEYAKQKLGGSL